MECGCEKQEKTLAFQVSERAPRTVGQECDVIPIERVASIVTGSIYVYDLKRKCFRYVSNHGLFLCGYPRDEVMEQGYDFFSRITHPDDLSLLDGVRGIILQGLSSYSDELDDLDYLSFKFRIRNYPELMESDYQMVYQKITSATISNNTQSVICFMTNAVTQTSGHLRSYNKHGLLYKVFSFQSNKWVEPNPEDLEKLTPREALTVKYIEQGKSVEEIAEIFHRTYNTIQSHIRNICRKLNLHSMGDLVVYAPTHKLIFIPKKLKTKN